MELSKQVQSTTTTGAQCAMIGVKFRDRVLVVPIYTTYEDLKKYYAGHKKSDFACDMIIPDS